MPYRFWGLLDSCLAAMEAEVRKILTNACMIDRKSIASLQQLVDQLYHGEKPANVVEHLIQERRQEAENE
jgi:hypothetical protein